MITHDALSGQAVLAAAVFKGAKLGLKRFCTVGYQSGQNALHPAGAQRKACSVERLGRDGALKVDSGESVYLQIKQEGGGRCFHLFGQTKRTSQFNQTENSAKSHRPTAPAQVFQDFIVGNRQREADAA
jgi:hypothetical protein